MSGGNLGARTGPIPARAGQPMPPRGRCCPRRAYPRSRGATANSALLCSTGTGLSPLARGNHSLPIQPGARPGPIPARAGQPCSRKKVSAPCRAYPRSRGATTPTWIWAACKSGLSPLARGNRRRSRAVLIRVGPIPARAGQPSRAGALSYLIRAYPRSRGATPTGSWYLLASWGLSPLARGNPPVLGGWCRTCGPIPARAGQPATAGSLIRLVRAYPRSRGATAN